MLDGKPRRRRKHRASILPDSVTVTQESDVEGWLLLKNQRGKWKPRYFKTQGHYLLYKKKRSGSSKWLGGVDLEGLNTTVEIYVPRDHKGAAPELVRECLRIRGLDTVDGEERAMRTMELQEHVSHMDSAECTDTVSLSIAEWHRELSKRSAMLKCCEEGEEGEEEEGEEEEETSALKVQPTGFRDVLVNELSATIAQDSLTYSTQGVESSSLAQRNRTLESQRMSTAAGVTDSEEDVEMANIEGWLMKLSPRNLWQPRYFKAEGRYLLYKKKRKWLGRIDLQDLKTTIEAYKWRGLDKHGRKLKHKCLRIRGLDTLAKAGLRTVQTISVRFAFQKDIHEFRVAHTEMLTPPLTRWYSELSKMIASPAQREEEIEPSEVLVMSNSDVVQTPSPNSGLPLLAPHSVTITGAHQTVAPQPTHSGQVTEHVDAHNASQRQYPVQIKDAGTILSEDGDESGRFFTDGSISQKSLFVQQPTITEKMAAVDGRRGV